MVFNLVDVNESHRHYHTHLRWRRWKFNFKRLEKDKYLLLNMDVYIFQLGYNDVQTTYNKSPRIGFSMYLTKKTSIACKS